MYLQDVSSSAGLFFLAMFTTQELVTITIAAASLALTWRNHFFGPAYLRKIDPSLTDDTEESTTEGYLLKIRKFIQSTRRSGKISSVCYWLILGVCLLAAVWIIVTRHDRISRWEKKHTEEMFLTFGERIDSRLQWELETAQQKEADREFLVPENPEEIIPILDNPEIAPAYRDAVTSLKESMHQTHTEAVLGLMIFEIVSSPYLKLIAPARPFIHHETRLQSLKALRHGIQRMEHELKRKPPDTNVLAKLMPAVVADLDSITKWNPMTNPEGPTLLIEEIEFEQSVDNLGTNSP